MLFHSTSRGSSPVELPAAVANGLADDGGLFMPDSIPLLPRALYRNLPEMSLPEIAYVVCDTLLSRWLSSRQVKELVDSALDFEVPMVQPEAGGPYVMELFHGPTLSFKDAGARFMARLLPMLLPERERFNVLLATSGDSGGAVADSFRNIPGARVVVLFPRGELSRQHIAMFSDLENVKAVEVGGTFDDCQRLVKQALADKALNARVPLTSGNSINLARQFPSIIYFFHAYARVLERKPDARQVVISVPCGNLGNLAAALMAKKMGLPVEKMIGANNANDTFVEYLKTGGVRPRRALITLARAMDVGNPSNLARIIDLYDGDIDRLRGDVIGAAYTDRDIVTTMRRVYESCGYLLGPQSATAYRALGELLPEGGTGVVMATGHPAKFPGAVMEAIGRTEPLPERLSGLNLAPSAPMKIPPSMNALQRIILQ